MDRSKILARIIGPFVYDRRSLTWEFTARRDINHHLKRVTGHRFFLTYNTTERRFQVKGMRRVSKRNKRQEVEVSRGMTAYLRSRLAPADIAKCVAASLVRPTQHTINNATMTVGGVTQNLGPMTLTINPRRSP